MFTGEKFHSRGFNECLTSHPLLREKAETDIHYFERLFNFFEKRFSLFGGAYLLPHHFLSFILDIKTLHSFAKPSELTEQSLEVMKPRMKTILNLGISVSTLYPLTEEIPGDFSVSYNTDTYGKNSEHKDDYAVIVAAFITACIRLEGTITIGNHHQYDPFCFFAEILGTGKHCLASSMEQYQEISQGEILGDRETLLDLINIIQSNKLEDKALQVILGSSPLNHKIIISPTQIETSKLNTLISHLKALQQKRREEAQRERELSDLG